MKAEPVTAKGAAPSGRYRDFNSHLKARFGGRVQKITIDAGFGCPNRDGTLSTGGCIYCNTRGSGTGAHAAGISVDEQIRRAKKPMFRRYKATRFLAYFQAFTNTYAPLAQLEKIWAEALADRDVVGLAIGTRPDCAGDEVLDHLQELARNRYIWLEYGLQSAHDATLARINRGHDFAAFREAVERTAGRGINICTHVILGLPGETRSQMMATVDAVSRLPVDGIKLHLLYVIRGTRLEHLYRGGTFRCMEQQEYVETVCEAIERLRSDIIVQRLTGDPHPAELIAPDWALDKRGTMDRIAATLEKRHSRQGMHCERSGRRQKTERP